MKKTYEKPAVIHSEKLEGRAAVCQRSDDINCQPGPVQT
jgi:hypothetical protein